MLLLFKIASLAALIVSIYSLASMQSVEDCSKWLAEDTSIVAFRESQRGMAHTFISSGGEMLINPEFEGEKGACTRALHKHLRSWGDAERKRVLLQEDPSIALIPSSEDGTAMLGTCTCESFDSTYAFGPGHFCKNPWSYKVCTSCLNVQQACPCNVTTGEITCQVSVPPSTPSPPPICYRLEKTGYFEPISISFSSSCDCQQPDGGCYPPLPTYASDPDAYKIYYGCTTDCSEYNMFGANEFSG